MWMLPIRATLKTHGVFFQKKLTSILFLLFTSKKLMSNFILFSKSKKFTSNQTVELEKCIWVLKKILNWVGLDFVSDSEQNLTQSKFPF